MLAALGGCSTPFAQSTGINWYGKPAAGTITVSDPKMYRREALINERNKDVAWIDDLIDKSGSIEFKPEIAREIEQISALSAALGLSFDPASGLNYRRSKQTGDLQQQIDIVQLQLQLDQLKRDAELARKAFDAQTTPLNADPTKLVDGSSGTAASTTPTAAAEQLTAAIQKLTTSLADRLGETAKGVAAPANVGTNPADLFRDRSAYRDLLKNARNAASLDELHDAGGDALIRLNFQATVLPDRKNSDVPGVIQMIVVPPKITDAETHKSYLEWLDYLNANLNIKSGDVWKPNPLLMAYGITDNFDFIYFNYPKPSDPASAPPPVAPAKAKKAKAPAKPAPKSVLLAVPATCSGLTTDPSPQSGCARLIFAVPKMTTLSAQEGPYADLTKYFAIFHLGSDDVAEEQAYRAARRTIVDGPARLFADCGQPQEALATSAALTNAMILLLEARARSVGGAVLFKIDRLARAMLLDRGYDMAEDPRIMSIGQRAARSEILLRSFEQSYPVKCTAVERQAFRGGAGTVYVPPRFQEAITRDSGHIAVYDIGPREQVQQLSTVARSANSLSLALSVAASAPGSGVAANGAAAYSREAMGRAEALERLPAVVGYSVISRKTFGWVIGPRASVNPKGKIELDQTLRTYDLTVDLSVPSWWPSFCLDTVTGWAPQPRQVADAAAAFDMTTANIAAGASQTCAGSPGNAEVPPNGRSRYVRAATVSLSPNDSDFGQLTSYLGLGGVDQRRRAALDDALLAGQMVSGCRATSIFVRGESIWRTSTVIAGGYKLDAGAITVSPDMSGVIIDVPALDDKIAPVQKAKIPVNLLTPYGIQTAYADYDPKPAAGCKPVEKSTDDGPSVASFTPTVFSVPSLLVFSFTGAKLDLVDGATLNGQPGKVEKVAGGKALKVTFARELTEGLPVSRTVPLMLFKGNDQAVVKTVEVTANNGGK